MIKIDDYTIGSKAQLDINKVIADSNPSKVVVLVDEVTVIHCLPIFLEDLRIEVDVICIPTGEKNKNIDTCNKVWSEMTNLGMDRDSLLINVGGGVVGDLGGFCAATFMRGIKFIQIPTTLLAMVDSSIGGKVGIDHKEYKNLIGSFCNPLAVIINENYLSSLPARQLLSGFGEIIKYGLIDDLSIWNELKACEDLTQVDVSAIIFKCLKIKAKLVTTDPFENGVRKILNCGHSIGHAIESSLLLTDNPLLHGEAIAIGIVCEAYISYKQGRISEQFYFEIKQNILKWFGHKYKSMQSNEEVLKFIKHDKKNKGGRILLSLLEDGGNCTFNIEVEKDELIAGLNDYKKKII